eukprot:snap_masked-scaffold_33-processed-gene-0.24-mRNA-1 protein AED:0.12 eAED:0.12 QI:0/-1/0/1/-1/1/1/0/418
MKLLERLKNRNLFYSITSHLDTVKAVNGLKPAVYFGIDPTADGLHLGNLVGFRVMKEFAKEGFDCVFLVGGGTANIGDPSFRERDRGLDKAYFNRIEENKQGIIRDIESINRKQGLEQYKIVDNESWLKDIDVISFLRDTGTSFRVNNMLSKESMKSRLNNTQHGLTFTELSYQVLQAYDFDRLFHEENCIIQVGGSDQWGNIISGIDLIKQDKNLKQTPIGYTYPLMTDAKGNKLGKSADNPIFVNKHKTTNIDFYNYFINMEDENLSNLFLTFTDLDEGEIEGIINSHSNKPSARTAQKLLARELFLLCRSEADFTEAETSASILFRKHPNEVLSDEYLRDILRPTYTTISKMEAIRKCLFDGSISKSEIRRLVKSRGIKRNGLVVELHELNSSVGSVGETVILSSGKRRAGLKII